LPNLTLSMGYVELDETLRYGSSRRLSGIACSMMRKMTLYVPMWKDEVYFSEDDIVQFASRQSPWPLADWEIWTTSTKQV
jgi:hypothetical protein